MSRTRRLGLECLLLNSFAAPPSNRLRGYCRVTWTTLFVQILSFKVDIVLQFADVCGVNPWTECKGGSVFHNSRFNLTLGQWGMDHSQGLGCRSCASATVRYRAAVSTKDSLFYSSPLNSRVARGMHDTSKCTAAHDKSSFNRGVMTNRERLGGRREWRRAT